MFAKAKIGSIVILYIILVILFEIKTVQNNLETEVAPKEDKKKKK